MAMTLRIPEQLDAQLAEIAESRHVSKHALVIELIRQFTAEEAKTRETVLLTKEILGEYSELFTRLEDA